MQITIIVAMSENKIIGINNQIPWKLSTDMQFFKAQTTYQTIVMGRKTFDSLKKPLPNRNNWILTTQKDFLIEHINTNNENIYTTKIFHQVENILEEAQKQNIKNLFIIGGKQIYELFLPIATDLLITKVKANVAGDTIFPDFEVNLFTQKTIQVQEKNEKNEFDFEIISFEKNKNIDK
ncbi:MAG: dihydrofolate reductase [Bacteroidetes bacterium]|nr:MAG: dihydrofolate reductase [Bacteroidota bacterium]TAG89384.1 MAG: dihydrofolate reductase [Bacteroidota bacterium]